MSSATFPPSRSDRCTIRNIYRLVAVSILLSVSIDANDKPAKAYPEHGKIVAVHVGNDSRTLPAHTDPYGKIQGGGSVNRKTHTYRIETDALIYELTEYGRGVANSLGDEVDFRVEKDRAFIKNGDKERKCDVSGLEQKAKTP
jgi:hypothetical protein